jgi:hypothetical protein
MAETDGVMLLDTTIKGLKDNFINIYLSNKRIKLIRTELITFK